MRKHIAVILTFMALSSNPLVAPKCYKIFVCVQIISFSLFGSLHMFCPVGTLGIKYVVYQLRAHPL